MSDSGSGTFYAGDTGDTFTITVSNSGTAATGGTVSAVITLPTGLTATAFSGTGWTVNLSTLTATRSDALASGVSYSALTLTVNVASAQSGSLTTTATVSGGGEKNTSNDTASDTTAISAAFPVVTGVSPSPSGGTLAAGTTTLTITFNEAVVGAGSASNYQLRGVGADGLFNTSDDVLVPLTVSYSGDTATLTFAGLTESIYRLTIYDTITTAAAPSWTATARSAPIGSLISSSFPAALCWAARPRSR